MSLAAAALRSACGLLLIAFASGAFVGWWLAGRPGDRRSWSR